jgi:hypothetical protein
MSETFIELDFLTQEARELLAAVSRHCICFEHDQAGIVECDGRRTQRRGPPPHQHQPHCAELGRPAASGWLAQARGVERSRSHEDLPGHRPAFEPGQGTGALAEYGRIGETLHLLDLVDDKVYRRSLLVQINTGERRHSLARTVFRARRGELRQAYRVGQEDQLGALGLAASLVPNGNILLVDNGTGPVPQPSSRLVEIDPSLGKIVWSYEKAPIAYSGARISNAQRLWNGNTLITEGEDGRLFEVTANGAVVWEYINKYWFGPSETNVVTRAYRYPRVDLRK